MASRRGARAAPARAERLPRDEQLPGRLDHNDTLPRSDAPARNERETHAACVSQPGGRVLTPAAPRERLAYLARKIHRLGERPLFELFVELAAGAPLVKRLEVYARPDPDFVAALGGDRLPPLRSVTGERNDGQCSARRKMAAEDGR